MKPELNTTLFALSVATIAFQLPAYAQTDPAQKDLPALIQVAAGNKIVLEAQAEGTITYECRKEQEPLTAYKWTMVKPQAVLKDKEGKEVGAYSGPPARWTMKDGSFVTGSQVAVSPNGEKNLPLQLAKADVSGGLGDLTAITYIQRVNTLGGVAPKAKCSESRQGEKVDVDYSAQYRFWRGN
jgi:hypothetical protein